MARKPIEEICGGVTRGYLTVIGEGPERRSQAGNYVRLALAKCICGSEKLYQANNLKSGKQAHCGCQPRKPMPRAPIEELCGGEKFGSLVLLGETEGKAIPGHGVQRKAICKCIICGSVKEYFPINLKRGASEGCGCDRGVKVANAKFTHGHSKSKTMGKDCSVEYRTWSHLIGRCENPNDKAYDNYGGRGIKVCRRWRNSFEAFYEDMGKRPDGPYSIERIDNDGDYEPDNCKWALYYEQCRNKRQNRMISAFGMRLCLKDMAQAFGLKHSTLGLRLDKGWDVETALLTPLHPPRPQER